VTRIRLPLVVLLAALGLAAVAAAADSTDPKVKTTKADQRTATASLLRFSDLGAAWTGGAIKAASIKIPVCPANQPNNSDLTITGHSESALALSSQGVRIDTDVEVFKTPRMVAKLYTRMVRPTIGECLKYDLAKSLGGGAGLTIGAVSQPELAPVGSHSTLYRVLITVKSAGAAKVTVFSDFMFLSQGRTQFFVNVIAPSNLGAQLLALENRVAKILAARARA